MRPASQVSKLNMGLSKKLSSMRHYRNAVGFKSKYTLSSRKKGNIANSEWSIKKKEQKDNLRLAQWDLPRNKFFEKDLNIYNMLTDIVL